MSIIEESLLRNFEMLDPFAYSRMISHEMLDNYSLIVTLDDGRKLLYDQLTDSTRYLSTDPDSMSEDEMMFELQFKLHRMMIRKGYDRVRLSEETGISVSMIGRYLNGTSIPSIINVKKIANAMGCTVNDLLYINN